MRYKIELVLSEEVSDIASPSTTPSTSVERPLVSDFEKSPLRFEFEAAMEEYRSLRVQIVQHLSDQQQITSFAVGLIAAMVALSQFLPANVRIDLVVGNPSLLVLSLPFSALTLGYLWHDVSMIWIGRYIDGRLRPRIEAIQTQATEQTRSLLAWESFHFSERLASKSTGFLELMLASSRYLIALVPSFILVVMYVYGQRLVVPVLFTEGIALGTALMMNALVIIALIYVFVLVRRSAIKAV